MIAITTSLAVYALLAGRTRAFLHPAVVSGSATSDSFRLGSSGGWSDFEAMDDPLLDDEIAIDTREYAVEDDPAEVKAQMGSSVEGPEIDDPYRVDPIRVPAGSQLDLDEETVLGLLQAAREELGTLFGYSAENRGELYVNDYGLSATRLDDCFSSNSVPSLIFRSRHYRRRGFRGNGRPHGGDSFERPVLASTYHGPRTCVQLFAAENTGNHRRERGGSLSTDGRGQRGLVIVFLRGRLIIHRIVLTWHGPSYTSLPSFRIPLVFWPTAARCHPATHGPAGGLATCYRLSAGSVPH